MPNSHMQRTMRLIEKWGWVHYDIVERFNNWSGKKNDFLGIIDLIAVTSKGVVGIQSCGGDFQPHVKKLLEEEVYNTRIWLQSPKTQLWLIGWRKLKVKRGGTAMRFYPRIAEITLSKKGKIKLKELPLEK